MRRDFDALYLRNYVRGAENYGGRMIRWSKSNERIFALVEWCKGNFLTRSRDILPTSSALLPSSGRWIAGRSSHVFTLGRRCSPERDSRAATLGGTRSRKQIPISGICLKHTHSDTRQQATAGNSETICR